MSNMRFYFYPTIRDHVLDHDILIQLECEVEISGDIEDGEPNFWCSDVFLEDKSIKHGSGLSKALYGAISDLADDELNAGGALFERVLEEQGIGFDGVPGDPDARYVRF
jgi:hypothetical protein